MPTRSMGTIVFARTPRTSPVPRSPEHLSFLTLQRGNAVRDAPRHRSAQRHTIRRGRGASRTACPRGAWAR
ncbi:DUF1534 domain-containing protein [Pseudomonas congelans]|nr:DUF1534 domain-containing protein [Pseudomonas congelans]